MFFNSGAGSFTLRGNGINFFDYSGTDAKIENDSTSSQTLSFPITAASFFVPQLEMNPVSGNITNLGPVSLWGANQLQVWGNNGKTIVFGPGSVINNLGSVAINQNSIVIFQATNTYSGDTYVNAGTLRLATNDATINSTIRLGDLSGSAGANLYLDGGLVLTSIINPRPGSSGPKIFANTPGTSGNANYAGNLYLDANTLLYGNFGGSVTLSGAILDLKSNTLAVAGITTISGSLITSSGGGNLAMNGAGVLTLTPAAHTYTGATTISAGELIAQTGGSISNSTVSVTAGATNGIQVVSTGGQWVCGSLTYGPGTTYADFDFTRAVLTTTNAPILVNGNLSFNGVLNVILHLTNSAVAAGYYPLIQYTGALSGIPPTAVFAGLPSGTSAVIVNTGRSIGILSGRALVGWGDNSYGQISPPMGLTNAVAISAGLTHALAVTSGGTVAAWGDNSSGQTNVPSDLSNVVSVAAASYGKSLALKSDGTVLEWGSETAPPGLSGITAIAAGGISMALTSNRTVVAWGVGLATNVPSGLSNVTGIAAGTDHNLALKSNGTVVAWGYNGDGETNVPTWLSNVVAIAAGGYHSLALRSNGTVVSWGFNCCGQTNVPTWLSNVVAIAAGGYHSLAFRRDGSVIAWGDNLSGETNVPVGLLGAVAIAGGGGLVSGALTDYSLALAPPFLGPVFIQPLSSNVPCGASTSFSAQANGSSPLCYQWHINGQSIGGATNSTLVITNVSCLSTGIYSVVVSNQTGSASSSNASLTVLPFVLTCPGEVTMTNLPPPNTNSVTAYNPCGKVTVTNGADTLVVSGCTNTYYRPYYGVDSCGRFAACTQRIDVLNLPQVSQPPHIVSQSNAADGLHVTICATATQTDQSSTYDWCTNSPNGGSNFVITTANPCVTIIFGPLDQTTNVSVVVHNGCGSGSGSGSVGTCAICPSRGLPSLVTSADGSGLGPIRGATNNCVNGAVCGTVSNTAKWFRMIPNETGLLTISTEGTLNEPLLAVYTGPLDPTTLAAKCCDASTSNHASRVTFNAVKGSVYWVVVDAHTTSPALQLATGFEPYLNYNYNARAGWIELSSTNAPAVTYRLLATTALVARANDLLATSSGTNWQTVLTTNLGTNRASVFFRDTNAATFKQRFYRLAAP
jgi:autotransporter-associated beta strand protein